MDIRNISHGDLNEIIVSGRIDGIGANQLKAALVSVIASGVHRIVVNLQAATFLGSAGLGALLQYWRQLQSMGGTLHVSDPSPEVLLLLKVSGFKDMIIQNVQPGAT